MQAEVKNQNTLDKITSTIGELPASPAVVSAVMGLTADLNSSVEDLGEVLAADPILTAKVLRLSNSSFYGRSRSVSSLKEAILILGFYTLRSMVIASSAHKIFNRKDNAVFGQKLWDHSLACGMASRLVAQHVSHPKIEEIFIVGLLHDIGKIVLGQKLMAVYDQVVKNVEQTGLTFVHAERDQLGFTHVEVGVSVLDKWNFPAELVEGVRLHHECDEGVVDARSSIGCIVSFSNLLAKKLGVGFGKLDEELLSSHPLAVQNSIDATAVIEMTKVLDERFRAEKHLFEDN